MRLALILMALISTANARDLGQWEDSAIKQWYQTLMQPDNPAISCCGEADAYWCDDINVKGGKTFCTITDDRTVPRRPSIPMGTKIEIPDHKMKWDRGNPTGHNVVFISVTGAVLCFVQGAGI